MAALSIVAPSVIQTLDERLQSSVCILLRLGQFLLRLRQLLLGLGQLRQRFHTLVEKFAYGRHLSFGLFLHPVHTGICSVRTGFRSRLAFEDEPHCFLYIHDAKNSIGTLFLAADRRAGGRNENREGLLRKRGPPTRKHLTPRSPGKKQKNGRIIPGPNCRVPRR